VIIFINANDTAGLAPSLECTYFPLSPLQVQQYKIIRIDKGKDDNELIITGKI
jgi:hypothetical protein